MVTEMQAQFYRKQWVLFFFCLWMSFFANAASTPAPRAEVDKTIIDEGDTITLTVRVDSSFSSKPDFKVLQRDFEISNSSRNSQASIGSDGKIALQTQWQLELTPKRNGQLQIPPINMAGSQTQPITIQVNPQKQSNTVDGTEPLFLQVEVDSDNVYVNQQILLTARIYVNEQLTDNLRWELTKPAFDNAAVEQLADTPSTTTINQTHYQVLERKYAIFPQQAGNLTIPELVFNAIAVSTPRSLLDFPGRGRPLRAISKQLLVNVKPIPKNFTGSAWLPARNLTLTGTWSGDQQHLSVGDSMTRSVTVRADGVLATQLPTLDQPQINAAKLYADQPELKNSADANGVHGTRVENIVLIPTQAGSLPLPETRIVWWDLDSDSEKIATLPGETLTITAGANVAATMPPAPQSITPMRQQPDISPRNDTDPITVKSQSIGSPLGWQIATAVFVLLWIITLLAYLQLRRRSLATAIIANETYNPDEKSAWKHFADACRTNNPAVARQQLLQWAIQFYRDKNVRSIEQLRHIANTHQLTRELQLMDNRLFGTLRDSSDWNGENLLQVVSEIRKHKTARSGTIDTALPPLYSTT